MTQAMENALWYKGKSPIINEYMQTAKQVEDRVAKQGFLYRPGFLSDLTTQLEMTFKAKLSGVNYEIVKQAIEREIAETGHDYDIAVKEAMIAWELEKSTTLTALEQEFADNKVARERDKEVLNRLKIETDLQQLVIIATKAEIETELEELRQELPDIERMTFDYETALLNARLLTAQKKLEVIPYIEAVLEKQQSIIDEEEANADRKNALITAKQDLNDKRSELITAREAIAAQIVLLIAAKEALVDKKQDLVDAREEIATVEEANINYLEQYINALTGLDDVKKDLITAKKALIPKINEKSAALIAYAAEIDAWILVKQAIAKIKEQIADEKIAGVGHRQDIMDAKITLADLENTLKEARLNLEIARLTGRTDLLTLQVENATELLEARQAELDAEIARQSDLLSGQLDYDLYAQTIAIETTEGVEAIEIEAVIDEITDTTSSWITERNGTTAAAVNTEITSKLVHLLT